MKQLFFSGLSKLGFHRIAYTLWGNQEDPLLVCAHGFTRNGRDFDVLAKTISQTQKRCVVCPDMVGRGQSTWLSDPNLYDISQYISDMVSLIARLNVDKFEWLGTSMGGIIGIILAGQANSPIKKLILNDIGPFIPKKAKPPIIEYAEKDLSFSNIEEVTRYLQNIYGKCDALSSQEWERFSLNNIRKKENGRLGLAYDPKIIQKFSETIEDVDIWEIWDKIQCPVVVLRATESNVLLPETAQEMTLRGPKAQLIELQGCTHAPLLISNQQLELIKNTL